MATYRVSMTLSSKSIRKAAEQVAEIGRGFNMKVWKATRITAEHVKRFIELQYDTGTDYIGYRRYSIDIIQLPKRQGYQVVGSGEGIYFLEYGTGIYAGKGQPDGGGPVSSVDKTPGSWSKTHGRQFIPGVKEWWTFGHTIIEGSKAAWAFPYARIYSRDFIEQAIAEVFG